MVKPFDNISEKNIHGQQEWFDFTNVLYRSSDNLFSRIEQISEESRQIISAGN